MIFAAALLASAALAGALVRSNWMDSDRAAENARPQMNPVTPSSVSVSLDEGRSDPTALAASFDRFRQQLGSEVGFAYAPVGASDAVHVMGRLYSGPAWSTIKIPLSIALMRQLGGRVTSEMRSAVTASDNEAAQSVWQQLGDPSIAAVKVRDVLASTGDSTTEVQSAVVREGFSAFGQTEWSLAAQVRFLTEAACVDDYNPVIDMMGQIVSGQRWGLGAIDGAQFKGGWGPRLDGGYLVRQYGLLPAKGGRVAVAIAVETTEDFSGATADLDHVAGWIADNLETLEGGICR